jgi:hypothetical protein
MMVFVGAFILTGFFSFCPVYHLLGIRTKKSLHWYFREDGQ